MDVVVTCPMGRRAAWVAEGDHPGQAWSGLYSYWTLGGPRPTLLEPGDRVYIVALGKLRGYAPLSFVCEPENLPEGLGWPGQWALVRKGGAVAVTIDEEIRGFQGWRKRWWERAAEMPFPGWREVGAAPLFGALEGAS